MNECCCQGAQDCDGLRLNAKGELEFILYHSANTERQDHDWSTCDACPLCGEAWPRQPWPAPGEPLRDETLESIERRARLEGIQPGSDDVLSMAAELICWRRVTR